MWICGWLLGLRRRHTVPGITTTTTTPLEGGDRRLLFNRSSITFSSGLRRLRPLPHGIIIYRGGVNRVVLCDLPRRCSWSDTEGGDIFCTDTEGGEREQYSGIGWWAREPKAQWMYHHHHPMPQTLVPLGHVYYGNWISIGRWGIISRCER